MTTVPRWQRTSSGRSSGRPVALGRTIAANGSHIGARAAGGGGGPDVGNRCRCRRPQQRAIVRLSAAARQPRATLAEDGGRIRPCRRRWTTGSMLLVNQLVDREEVRSRQRFGAQSAGDGAGTNPPRPGEGRDHQQHIPGSERGRQRLGARGIVVFRAVIRADSAMSAMEEVFLVLDGVDTVGRVFLNEQPSNKTDAFGPLGKHGKTRPFELLPTDVPGLPVQDMYLRHTFPVGAALKRTGINRLVVQTASVSPLVVGPVINASHHGLWVQHPWTYVRKEPSQVRNRANFLIFLDDVCLSRACLGSRRLFHTEKSNQNASVSRSSDGTGRRRQLKHRASGVPCIW
jgi:hypothetical protein